MIWALSCFMLVASCEDDDEVREPECQFSTENIFCNLNLDEIISLEISTNTIFRSTEKIEIEPYSYSSDGRVFNVSGDDHLISVSNHSSVRSGNINCCDAASLFDHLNNTPLFRWKIIDNPIIAVAIFKNIIKASSNNTIGNPEDIVWLWHSGLSKAKIINGEFMEIAFANGGGFQDGKVVGLPKLQDNHVYFWAIWGWDEMGIEVTRSSCQIPFLVNSIPDTVTLTKPRSIVGEWKLKKAIRIISQPLDVTDSFFIRKLSLSIDEIITAEDCFSSLSLEIKDSNDIYTFGTWNNLRNTVILSDSLRISQIRVTCNQFSGIIENSANGELYAIEFEDDS